MVKLCCYFNYHIPYKLNKYRIYDIGKNQNYFNDNYLEKQVEKLAFQRYFELNKKLINLIKKYPNECKFIISISGITVELLEKYSPVVLESFSQLARNENIEFVLEPYSNCLSSMYSEKNFIQQVEKQKKILEKYFNNNYRIFKNTNLVYSNDCLNSIYNKDIKEILIDDNYDMFKKISSNYLYKNENKTIFFIKNTILSNYIENIRNDKEINKIISKILEQKGEVLNIVLNANKFDEDKIKYFYRLIEKLTEKILLKLPSELIENKNNINNLNVLKKEFENTYFKENYLLNRLQKSALKELYSIENKLEEHGNKNLINAWEKLTNIDNLYYMNTKNYFDDKSKNIYQNPYNPYIYFMNILNDIIFRIQLKEEKIRLQNSITEDKITKISSDELKSVVLN